MSDELPIELPERLPGFMKNLVVEYETPEAKPGEDILRIHLNIGDNPLPLKITAPRLTFMLSELANAPLKTEGEENQISILSMDEEKKSAVVEVKGAEGSLADFKALMVRIMKEKEQDGPAQDRIVGRAR